MPDEDRPRRFRCRCPRAVGGPSSRRRRYGRSPARLAAVEADRPGASRSVQVGSTARSRSGRATCHALQLTRAATSELDPSRTASQCLGGRALVDTQASRQHVLASWMREIQSAAPTRSTLRGRPRRGRRTGGRVVEVEVSRRFVDCSSYEMHVATPDRACVNHDLDCLFAARGTTADRADVHNARRDHVDLGSDLRFTGTRAREARTPVRTNLTRPPPRPVPFPTRDTRAQSDLSGTPCRQ